MTRPLRLGDLSVPLHLLIHKFAHVTESEIATRPSTGYRRRDDDVVRYIRRQRKSVIMQPYVGMRPPRPPAALRRAKPCALLPIRHTHHHLQRHTRGKGYRIYFGLYRQLLEERANIQDALDDLGREGSAHSDGDVEMMDEEGLRDLSDRYAAWTRELEGIRNAYSAITGRMDISA
jgi:hypothetical protein